MLYFEQISTGKFNQVATASKSIAWGITNGSGVDYQRTNGLGERTWVPSTLHQGLSLIHI